MLVALLLAAGVTTMTGGLPARTTAREAAVFANRTAFTAPCTDFFSSAAARLAAQATRSLAALGWSTLGAVGPAFTEPAALAAVSGVSAFYVQSHGDHYWDPVAHGRSSGVRADAGRCENAPKIVANEIAAARAGAAPARLVVIASCHNGEARSTLPDAFGIARHRSEPGEEGPASFYVGYVGAAWQRQMLRFEGAFWAALLDGESAGSAFDRGLLSGFNPARLDPQWWGAYDYRPVAPQQIPPYRPGQRRG